MYNSAESEGTGVTLFYTNYGYTLEIYKALLVDIVYIYSTIVKVEELKALYEELSSDIRFIIVWSTIYYNKKYSIGPMLKEREKVYLLWKNVKI